MPLSLRSLRGFVLICACAVFFVLLGPSLGAQDEPRVKDYSWLTRHFDGPGASYTFVHDGITQFYGLFPLDSDKAAVESSGLNLIHTLGGLDVRIAPSMEALYIHYGRDYANARELNAFLLALPSMDASGLTASLSKNEDELLLLSCLIAKLWVLQKEEGLDSPINAALLRFLIKIQGDAYRSFYGRRPPVEEASPIITDDEALQAAETWYQEALGLEPGPLWLHWKALDGEVLLLDYLRSKSRYTALLSRLGSMRKSAIDRALQQALELVRQDPWIDPVSNAPLAYSLWPRDPGLLDTVSVTVYARTTDEFGASVDVLVPSAIWSPVFALLSTSDAPILFNYHAPVDVGPGVPATGRLDRESRARLMTSIPELSRHRAGRLGLPWSLLEPLKDEYRVLLMEHLELLLHARIKEAAK